MLVNEIEGAAERLNTRESSGPPPKLVRALLRGEDEPAVHLYSFLADVFDRHLGKRAGFEDDARQNTPRNQPADDGAAWRPRTVKRRERDRTRKTPPPESAFIQFAVAVTKLYGLNYAPGTIAKAVDVRSKRIQTRARDA
jgi:hypothetical protein